MSKPFIMQSFLTQTYERDEKTKLNSPLREILHFFNHEPEKYLEIAGLQIIHESYRNEKSGEWQVSEHVGGCSILPPTRYRIRWQSTEFGATWQSWAPFGIFVENSWQVRSMFSFDDSFQQEDETMCVIDEHATLRCPFYLYPFVKFAFIKAHKKLHKSLQCTLIQASS